MGLGTLNDRTNSDTIDQTWWNEIHSVLKGDFVGRATSGVPEAGHNLGTALYPWGNLYVGGIVANGSLLDFEQVLASVPYKVLSGKTRTTSNQPAFLTPAGSGGGRSLTIDATPTELALEIAGTQITLDSDIVVSGLTAAPSSNNTATLTEATASNQHATRTWGEELDRFYLIMGSVGSNISALVGKRAAFKMTNGGNIEYFTAFVYTAGELRDCRRGFFYDSTLAPMNRVVLNNGSTITLMKMGWLFLDADGATTEALYNEPIYSYDEPGSPATGDYWYDFTTDLWKRFDGATFQVVERILIGTFFCDASDCLGVRCTDFYGAYKADNTMILDYVSATQVRAKNSNALVNVMGNEFRFGETLPAWSITGDIAATADLYSASEGSRQYYFYLKDTGDQVVSDITPYWRGDLHGFYHPHNPWRCVGSIWNDGSNDFDGNSIEENMKENCTLITDRQLAQKRPKVTTGGDSTSTSATFVQVTNTNLKIRRMGRPIFIGLIPTGGAGDSGNLVSEVTNRALFVQLLRSSTVLAQWAVQGGANTIVVPVGAIWYVDFENSDDQDGYVEYQFNFASSNPGDQVQIQNARAIAFRL